MELYHHGIKGMRWGIRRTPEQLGHVRDINNNVRSISEETGKVIKQYGRKKAHRENISKMSDEELRRKVNRLGLERQYNSLTAPELSKGAEKAASILAMIGSVAAIGASGTSIAIAVKQLKKG